MKKEITKTEYVGILVDLAQEIDIKDSIDWGMLNVNEQQAFELMANSVVDQIHSLPEDQREIIMMASLTKLLVENFVLNARLNGAEA
jgi:hypothetical protein